MEIVHSIKDMQAGLAALRAQGKTVGLVPTMGALHAGHASLIKRSVAENDATVVSIFVNPTQFNDKNDLAKYPRTLEADCRLLEQCGATFAFTPSVEEIYPEPDTRHFSYAPLDTVMEGAFRPGHFNGVCQIVSKLFDIVKPDCAYFGEKDFQQLTIIREMVRQMKFPLKIVGCPIVREADGLALSSRNTLLSADDRHTAVKISQILFASVEFAASHTVAETQKFVEDSIAAVPGLRLEYFELVDGNTLQKIADWADTNYVVGCITVFCGEVRLIDNIKYKS
ncbi:pantoate--beta-alanine ligase [uncultured Bacteroides sp.]|uniref:pantoate--beta-alanine ligase n=1 Tax=uncultured Bacteroides sp. TaxID=162156 RepID=UPI00262D3498|nr:pantoate--beta-alanine ligase [uncultured Bacteroides sp.]